MERARLIRRARAQATLEVMPRLHRAQGRMNFLRDITEQEYDSVWTDNLDDKRQVLGFVLDNIDLKKAPQSIRNSLEIDEIEQIYAEIVLPHAESRDKTVELHLQSIDPVDIHILSAGASWLIGRMYKRRKSS